MTEGSSEDKKRKEAWKKLKVNVKEIEKPRNVLLLGCYGTGKSSFINTVIAALTGRYTFYADVCCGNKLGSTRLHKIPCKGYWNPSNEEDKRLNLPNFIDIIGLDNQLSNPEKVGTVNSRMINLLINGTLPENCDLLDLGKKLKEEMKIENSPEVESLAVDIIVVVISLKNDIIPHAVLKEIYKEANFRTRKIPVFSVLTKKDECDLSQKELEKRKKVIAETLGIAVENILICENYQPNQKLDSRDYEIFEFLTKICDPRYKAEKLQGI